MAPWQEFVTANRQCAINNIPFAVFDWEVKECGLKWLDAHSAECFDGDCRKHGHAFVSLRFSDGKIAGYNFVGGYRPGSSSLKRVPIPIVDWVDLTEEAATDMELDIDSLI